MARLNHNPRPFSVMLSAAKHLALRQKILRFAQNDVMRHFLLGYLLLALLLRSLIPVGYMPDFSASTHGMLPLMFCDGMDHGAMDMSNMPAGHEHHHMQHDGHHAGGLCPFGASAVFGMEGIAIPLVVALVFAIIETLRFVTFALRRRDVFSNTSPRSPPSVFA